MADSFRSFTTTDWARWLPKESDPDWIAAYLRRERRKKVRALMKKRLQELRRGG